MTGSLTRCWRTGFVAARFERRQPILVFFYMTFEHSVVNMFLFPSALIMR